MNKTRTSRRANQTHEGAPPMRLKQLATLVHTHSERTNSGQVLDRRYPIGRAMIPSLGIMPSPGDRRVHNLAQHILSGPRTLYKSNALRRNNGQGDHTHTPNNGSARHRMMSTRKRKLLQDRATTQPLHLV
jgi:hypothetical protein